MALITESEIERGYSDATHELIQDMIKVNLRQKFVLDKKKAITSLQRKSKWSSEQKEIVRKIRTLPPEIRAYIKDILLDFLNVRRLDHDRQQKSNL